MHRKWTRDELAPILFTDRECNVLKRLVQREMRCGSESVLEPKRNEGISTIDWTAEPRELLSEIERLQVIIKDGTYAVLGLAERAYLERQVAELRHILKLRDECIKELQKELSGYRKLAPAAVHEAVRARMKPCES